MVTHMPQVAKADGLYRCNGIGETKFAKKGDILPYCSREACGGTKRELRAEDQILDRDRVPVLIDRGMVMVIKMGEIPEVGMALNLRCNRGLVTKYNGVCRVTEVGILADQIHALVERVGDFDETLPIYDMGVFAV